MIGKVLDLPVGVKVLDMRSPIPEVEIERLKYAIGRYDEKRERVYTTPLFHGGKFAMGGAPRDIHVGIDLFAPVGTLVRSFADAEVLFFGENGEPGDYGPVIVTRQRIDTVDLYALYGHLSRHSLIQKKSGLKIQAGEVFGAVGARSENGGWPSHLHFQLSYERPITHDLPGVVAECDRAKALLKYPDPRLVLGPLY